MPDTSAVNPDASKHPLLDPLCVLPLLGPLACRFDIDALTSCTSTNDVLSQRALQTHAASGTVIVADQQQAGRGRRGRQWVSQPADSLTFSLLWRFAPETLAVTKLSGLSLAVGVALLRGLESLGHAGLRLKWPNDLLRITPNGTGKLGGILIELQSDRRGGMAAIIGIGLNLRPPVLPPGEAPAAGLVTDTSNAAAPDRHRVLAALLQTLAPALDTFAAQGFAAFRNDWEARHAWHGQELVVIDQGQILHQGRCHGITADGALLLDCKGQLTPVLAGDVSLRPASASTTSAHFIRSPAP